MAVKRLPSGRWRARIWHNGREHGVAKILGQPPTSFATKREATAAYAQARQLLQGHEDTVTVHQFWERWTTDPIFARPKESTNLHNRERTRAFADRYSSLMLGQIGRKTVNEWLTDGTHNGTVPALRAMFADAQRYEMIDRNPFAGLGLSKRHGNRDVQPPSEGVVSELIHAARELSGPSFAAWLQVAAYTGMRPGELDALRWDALDYPASRILVAEQFSHGSRTFTLPKNGKRRWAMLTGQARDALMALPHESEFCFVNLRGQHWTASSRAYHWKATRAAVGYEGSLYLATRHFAGWYMINVLRLSPEDVAVALGHTDGGQLVRTLYGHLDGERALDRVLSAYRENENGAPDSPRIRHAEGG